MGQGALANSIFSITTMAIAVPTGVKILTGCSRCGKGRFVFTVPMLYSVAFIPTFHNRWGYRGYACDGKC